MKNLLGPDKTPTTQQRSESNKVQFGEPVGLLGLLTPEDECEWLLTESWTAQSQLHHHKSIPPSMANDSENLYPWRSAHRRTVHPVRISS